MPVHDWTKVDAGIFHAFHLSWLGQLQNALNEGLLPADYYALAEQHAGQYIADLLTLHANLPTTPTKLLPEGGIALADSPPKVRRKLSVSIAAGKPRTLAIRHVSDHRLVALMEIVSPGNKDRKGHVEMFVNKAASALDFGVNLLVVDHFPPGLHDPRGMNGAIWECLNEDADDFAVPEDEPLSLAGYLAAAEVDIFLEHVAVGGELKDMPLFLQPERFVNVPLEATYQAAFRGMPAVWRKVLENGACA